MTILFYILFLAIYVYCLKYINTPVVFVKHPFLKNRQFPITGVQQFFLFLLLTSIFSLGPLMMANRLLVNILLCLFVIFIAKNRPVFGAAAFLYTLFLLWLVVAIMYSPVPAYGFRVFLKYLYPFIMLILASKIATTPLFGFKTVQIIFYVGILGFLHFLIFMHIPVVGGLFFWWPAILDFFPLPICIALAYYSMLHKKKYLLLALLFVAPSIMWTNRTGLLVASVAIVLYSIIRYKLKSLPYVALGVAILVGSILYIPAVRNKMFKKSLTTEEIIENRETLTTEDIDSSGRFAMWEWSLGLYYEGRELTGSGLGVLQERFYSLNHPFAPIQIVHNDYVQLLCDTGLIGLISYLSVFLFILIHCIILAWNKRKPWIIRFLAMIAGPATIAMAVGSYFDNVVNYTLLTLGSAFAVYGVLIGLNQRMQISNE
jgi:hypothetical protein